MFSDGELQAFLANEAVKVGHRGKGIGRELVIEALRHAGGERVDLLSEENSVDFYDSFRTPESLGAGSTRFMRTASGR